MKTKEEAIEYINDEQDSGDLSIASEREELLNILYERGEISDETYDELIDQVMAEDAKRYKEYEMSVLGSANRVVIWLTHGGEHVVYDRSKNTTKET